MKKSHSKGGVVENGNNEGIDWELRPCGVLVQKRCDGVEASRPMIQIKVSHGSYQYDINIPAQSTFGDLKRLLSREIGLESKEQRLLFRGKVIEDQECLHMVGVKDMSNVILFQDPASKERKLDDMKRDHCIWKACEAVTKVRTEVDKLAEKVSLLESAVQSGTKVSEKEFIVLTELLMVQVLKLDSIEAEGEAKGQRRIEVRRVQSFIEKLDVLKARNSNPFGNRSNAVNVTTKWETVGSGVGSLTAPTPIASSSKITQDWELFD